jgi:hypothetical protein
VQIFPLTPLLGLPYQSIFSRNIYLSMQPNSSSGAIHHAFCYHHNFTSIPLTHIIVAPTSDPQSGDKVNYPCIERASMFIRSRPCERPSPGSMGQFPKAGGGRGLLSAWGSRGPRAKAESFVRVNKLFCLGDLKDKKISGVYILDASKETKLRPILGPVVLPTK